MKAARLSVMVSIGVALLCAQATGGTTKADRCEAGKLKAAGKYGECRLRAEARAVVEGDPVDYGRCAARYAAAWTKAEANAEGTCSTSGDQAAVQGAITEHTDLVTTALATGLLPDCTEDLLVCTATLGQTQADLATCTSNLNQSQASLSACSTNLSQCQADLAACQAVPQGQRLKTAQTTCYDAFGALIACTGTGQDGELQKGLSRQYIDNGDGTVTDVSTGLMWEKKSTDGGIHDVTAEYTWTNAFAFIESLNTANFAGHNDWRLPNINELHSIVNYGTANPAVDAVFNTSCTLGCTVTACSCTQTAGYWSSSTYLDSPSVVWYVSFGVGFVHADNKTNNGGVRAVRGGF